MFESPRSLWQHFAVAIVAVLVIMSLSSVNANNENDQWMLIKFDFSPKKGALVVKFAFATAILKIEILRMRRRFARVFVSPQRWRPVICVSPPPLPYKVQIPAQIMLFTAKTNSKQLNKMPTLAN